MSAAGHPLPVVLRANGDVERVGVHGPALGVLEEVDLRDVRTVLKPGDLLVLYTDGITEHRAGSGELLGDDRLVAALADAAPASAGAALQALRAAIARFEPSPPRDDIAMFAIRVEDGQITAVRLEVARMPSRT